MLANESLTPDYKRQLGARNKLKSLGIIRYLIEKGADVNWRTTSSATGAYDSVIKQATQIPPEAAEDILSILMDHDPKVEERDFVCCNDHCSQ